MEHGSDEIVRLLKVSKSYNGTATETTVLKNISLNARKGEMILFLGPSGSGKTTLLTIIAGLQPATKGDVFLFGKQINEYSQYDLQVIRAKRIGFIFQNFNLISSLNVIQNVMMVLKFGGTDLKSGKRIALEYLMKLGIENLALSLPARISHGEKQRVAIARALVNGANLIIADEPTGSLSSKQGMEIVELLRKSCKDEGRCVIIASHDERITKMADKVLHLSDGELKSIYFNTPPYLV
jgi:putative ABC transport system ATP-binding protein